MREILNINADWRFEKQGAVEAVSLPHSWNAIDGQDGGNDYFRGACSYEKTLRRAELPAGECVYLEINGANASAEVFWNGAALARHDGGYSTFRVLLSPVLEENTLKITVDNSENETVYPQTADFTFYGGLYRDVNLIGVPAAHFALVPDGAPGVHVTPIVQDAAARLRVQSFLEGEADDARVVVAILDAEGSAIAENEGVDAEFTIENVHLWDGVRDPYLYTARCRLMRGGEVLDEVSARFGCRSYRIDPQEGFVLNGRSYPLRGVSRHQDWLGLGNALTRAHHEQDIALIREMGANTIRLAHYQHDQYFYDLCDEAGLVVWAEIPYISRHMPGANANTHSQMRELIAQCYNHPSIVVWGLSNEITMGGANDPDLIANHRSLNELAHTMDPTRPTVIACISMCGMDEEYVHIPDAVSYNHYFGWYGGSTDDNGPWFDRFHEKYPNTPIGCSEYGCEALDWHNSNPQQGDYSEEYQAHYHEELIRQLFSRKYIWATHVWNMFDFGADARAEGGENGQNHKGLVTFDRKYRKDAFYAYKAWLSDEPFVHICGKRYVDRVEEKTRVTVYSNQPAVELFVNGESLGKQEKDDHFFYFEAPNVGESELVAVAGECRDTARIRKVETMNPDYVLREAGAVLNWFDIQEVEGRFSLNDKMGDIMDTFRGKLWTGRLLLGLLRKYSAVQKQSGGKGMKTSGLAGMAGGAMTMLRGLSVLRMTSMLGMIHVNYSKEELLRLNRQLNRIRKK